MSLPVFISEIFVSWSTSYFQDRKPITYKRKYDNLLIDLCLSNVSKHDIDKITTQLLQRGFSVGSIFSYKEDFQSISSKDVIIKNNHEDTYAMTLVLTIELMNKLAVQNGIEMKQIHEYTSSQRAYFVQKSIDIIQRAGIKCDISLVHNQNELERIVSQLSVSELTSYYGHSTGVYLSWVKYTLLWLQVPSIVGIILFIFQFLSGFQLYFSFTPLLCIFTCVASLFYDKGLQQHLSLSIFSWGHISPFQYLPKSPLSSEMKVLFIPPLILSLFSALSLVICYLIIVLLINFLEEVFFSDILNLFKDL